MRNLRMPFIASLVVGVFATAAWDCNSMPLVTAGQDSGGAQDLATVKGSDAAADLATEAADLSTPVASTDLAVAHLMWFDTCGDPVCRAGGHRSDPGIPPCTTQKAGDPCSVASQQCDPVDDCNVHLVCASSDPKKGPGGCPISNRQLKQDIVYLNEAERESLHQDLLRIPLATFRYRDHQPSAKRLGFIIEDLKTPFPIAEGGGRVDVYGYSSMAVAALQAQEKQILSMQRQLDALQKQLKSLQK